MMSKQPEALRLADVLEQRWRENMVCPELEAAAELRSLEADKDDWKDASSVFKERAISAEARVKALEALNSELRIELVNMTDAYSKVMKDAGMSYYPEALVVVRNARAAIAKHGATE